MKLAAVDLNLLVAFDALLSEGSVSVAAARIGLSQPAMSKRLAHLRQLFADDLFVRSADGVRPTEKALDLADPIRAALRQIEDTLGGLGRFLPERSQRVFRIATTDHVTVTLIPDLMATLRRIAPGISLVIRSLHRQEVIDQLEKGSVDLAITILPDAPTSIKRASLFHVDWISLVSASHPEITDELTLGLFLKYPHLLVTHVGDLKGYIDRMLDDRGMKRYVAMSLPYALAVPAIIARTDMICTLSANLIDLASWPDIRSFPVPFEYSGYEETMLWHRRNDSDPGHSWLRRTLLEVSETVERRA
ncbi:DNA-binding transcriptional regulator, LysR family [Rhizobium mongolense subsp. loessense]|uniref:DNA-binding transcriptional regulator, LysR family n=1 Tax=Rhizobium mongolense subsp. loessense TaxID=158890 RepID=A0A1G4S9K4_9HYPH|nr:LysR family transcriptional regulator [Rhizobium mongolense]SCW65770.1 DNA-binding transcriptional regulator, LysR family [Rhizobium mongolense subsp. loessense]